MVAYVAFSVGPEQLSIEPGAASLPLERFAHYDPIFGAIPVRFSL